MGRCQGRTKTDPLAPVEKWTTLRGLARSSRSRARRARRSGDRGAGAAGLVGRRSREVAIAQAGAVAFEREDFGGGDEGGGYGGGRGGGGPGVCPRAGT